MQPPPHRRLPALRLFLVLPLVLLSAGGPTSLPRPQAAEAWVCPPCGSPCHDLASPAPGSCSACGMALVPESSVTTVGLLLFEGVDLASWAPALSVFATSGRVFVRTVADTRDPLRCEDALTVVPDRALSDAPRLDVLVLPGGYGSVWDDALVTDWVAEVAAGVEHVLAIGTGGLVAARAGLLPGGELALDPRLEPLVARVAPGHAARPDARLADGRVLSVRDAGAALTASLEILTALEGEESANRTAGRLGLGR